MRMITVMGINFCDFQQITNPTPFSESPFKPTQKVLVRLENGHFEMVDAEVLATQDPDGKYFLVKNPQPVFAKGNHYLVICNRVSIGAFPKPQIARDWANNIGNEQ